MTVLFGITCKTVDPRTCRTVYGEKGKGTEPETAGVEDPVASIRFVDVGCARAATVGEERRRSGDGDAVQWRRDDGDDGGGFPSLAAHPLLDRN